MISHRRLLAYICLECVGQIASLDCIAKIAQNFFWGPRAGIIMNDFFYEWYMFVSSSNNCEPLTRT